jgi:hypothetical protein
MSKAELGMIVVMTIAVLILAKGVGFVAFILYSWLRRTVPA